ncbi:glycoside hydrolase family 43 protein [Gryllotalpicola koreensis]|uniref:1,4-beta-xylanase n=1 Tax=Gryllotalpicola koreensis TaxID=993086 RepID=A0ABP8ACF4_9MICO
MRPEPYGYLFVHFVEEPRGGGENVFFSLSEGDDPTVWNRLRGGRPVLTSALGTTGARDPHLVRGDGEFYLVATDLLVWSGDDAEHDRTGDWERWQRQGSRSIVVWRSEDLVHWSQPWLAPVAPPTAGMAWAPESMFLPETGEYLVYWSSSLFDPADADHRADSYSRILVARTRDFRTFSTPRTLIDEGTSVIDASVHRVGTAMVRFAKEGSHNDGSPKLYQQVGSSFFADDFQTVATRLGDERSPLVEGPLMFKHHHEERWYLLVDQYARHPMGYLAYTSTDPLSGRWEALDDRQFRLPPSTKHGSVLPLEGDEWARVHAAFACDERMTEPSAKAVCA